MQLNDLSSAISGRTFPDHPYFPQLQTASDPNAMLELFRKHLKPLSPRATHIRECVAGKFRWRRDGSRCILQYALRFGSAGDGDGEGFLQWVTCVTYAEADDVQKAWNELKTVDRPIPDGLLSFTPATFVPEFRTIMYVFPYDRLLPHLSSIMSAPWPELQERLLACFGPGRWQIEQQTIEPLRYLFEDGAVARYTLRARDAAGVQVQTRRFYAKSYRTRQGQWTTELLQKIHDRTHFDVVEPVFYCAERRCMVLAEARGRSLQDLLQDSEDWSAAVRCVGRALAAFNQSDIPTTVSHSAEEQIAFLNSAAELLRWACPASIRSIDGIVNEVTANLRDVPHAPIHWDLKSDHVFLDGERVMFIDLDTVSRGDPARDPAHLAAHIACRIDVPDMPATDARLAAGALVEEYFAHASPCSREQFELQYLIAVIEAACGLFKRQEAGWQERATSAIEEAYSYRKASMGSSRAAFFAG